MNRRFPYHSTRASVSTGSTRRGSAAQGFREKSLVLDAAIHEYLRRKERGETIDVAAFCDEFPNYRHSLRRLIDVQERLPSFEMLPDEKWPEIGDLFAGYEIEELLGAGSIARVYLASDLQLGGRFVAIKVSRQGSYEAETLGKLDHPNIVQVYSVAHDEDSDLTIVCMPYRGSATLSDVLDASYHAGRPPERAALILDVARHMTIERALPDEVLAREQPDAITQRGTYVEAVVHLGAQLAAALQYAHERGVLHRDLKPSNVLLTPSGRPMVLDFNLSFDSDLQVVHHGGTLPYAAPEQLREAAAEVQPGESLVDAQADVFALGVILYELLTGKLPYGSPASGMGPRQAILWQLQSQERPAVPVAELNPGVSRLLANIVQQCIERDPAQRFATMAELERVLQGYLRPSRRLGRWLTRHRWSVASAAAGVLTAAALAGGYWASLPPYADRVRGEAVRRLDAHDRRGALQLLDELLLWDPLDRKALLVRAEVCRREGDLDQALESYRRAARIQDDDQVKKHVAELMRDMVASAERELRSGNLAAAVARLDRVLFEDRASRLARFLRGLAYQRLGQHQRAVEDFREIEGLENHPVLADHLGSSLFHAGRSMDAFLAYSRVEQGTRWSYQLELKKLYCQFDWRKNGSSMVQLNALVQSHPDQFEAHLVRAYILFRYQRKDGTNQLRDAVEDIRRASQLAPQVLAVRHLAAAILATAAAEQPALKDDVRVHLQEAARLGLSRAAVEGNVLFEAVAQEPWFSELVASCGTESAPPKSLAGEIADIVLPPPESYSQVLDDRQLLGALDQPRG